MIECDTSSIIIQAQDLFVWGEYSCSANKRIIQQAQEDGLATEEVTLSSLTHPLQQQDEDIEKITFCIKSRGVICFSLLKFFTLKAGPDLLIQLSGLSVNLSYPTDVTGDLTCCLTLADTSEPALFTLLRHCGTAPCSVTPSWLAFPLQEAPLWLFPNIPPLSGSHSNPLLKSKKASLYAGIT
ncbi:hypothetical protein Anapl_10824 [Anas platyrhynchos]|uniref:Uncharacterized protein n=1 Tax=Anas platyrhynchos TaxID=8839 RepID=R0JHH0_ANAPL|nr:hypothetical protein Anapl_10824 [Anas platyrhynchos]